ncbi:MAG: protein translocase subunit SecD [Solirubrobacteraceae bacterium]|nr:MAG: hypothetical protein DLM63_11400 [Solirubrobacterales bacterium]
MNDRARNRLVLVVVAVLVVASLLVAVNVPGLKAVHKPTRLGLDLKGGVELIYQGEPTPQQPKVDLTALTRAVDIMRKRVDRLGVAEPQIQTSGTDQIDVSLPGVKNEALAEQQVGRVAQLFFYDWETNVLGPNGQPAPNNQSVTGGGNPEAGVGALSYYDAVTRASKRLPGAPNCKRPPSTGDQYYLVNDANKTTDRGPDDSASGLTSEQPAPPGDRVVKVNQGTVVVQVPTGSQPKGALARYYVLNDCPVLNGTEISSPAQNFDPNTNAPNVTFDFSSSSARNAFKSITSTIYNRGREAAAIAGAPLSGTSSADAFSQHFAISLDNQLISVPRIDFTDPQNAGGIGDTGSEISGGFTISSAQQLAQLLKDGALPIKLKLISKSQVSATLGKQALNQGLLAGAIGLAVVVLFLLALYRVLGVIAVVALAIYGLYFFALIKLIPITLTLPGIAGLILTIGVAADANIVIFERVKEEIRSGKNIARGIAEGYKRGIAAIIDANVVTLMTAFILFLLATSSIKGFAFTLGIGTIVSLFTAVLATQAALGAMGRSRLISHPALLGAGPARRKWRFDFMGASRWFFSLSGCILLVGALAIGGRGLNFGIDFESGTQIQAALSQPASENSVRAVLVSQGISDPQIQRITNKALGPNAFQISAKQLQPDKVNVVRGALNGRFGGTPTFQYTTVGPTFGKTIARLAVIALIASLLVISAYIALRFEWKFAVPVLIALMHDLLITAGVYSLTGRELTISTVAALLTILGYSLYDTIIVFDRVRENIPRMPRAAFSQIVNRSMSEVLTRSLATSFSTLLPVIALLLFGGSTLKDFAFALLVGIASGAYSSIFIASPVLTHWKEREPRYARRRERILRESGGLIPAYATAIAGAPVDIEPEPSRRRRRGRRVPTPERPDGQISKEEFDDLVADLDVEDVAPAQVEDQDLSADRLQEPSAEGPATLGALGTSSGQKRSKQKRPRNRRHGRRR